MDAGVEVVVPALLMLSSAPAKEWKFRSPPMMPHAGIGMRIGVVQAASALEL